MKHSHWLGNGILIIGLWSCLVSLVGCAPSVHVEPVVEEEVQDVGIQEFEGLTEAPQAPVEEDVKIDLSEDEEEAVIELSIDQVIEERMGQMSLEEKVGQLFYLDVHSYESTNIPAGGVIFFKSDLSSWEGTIDQISGYQEASILPLFIGIDEEGGIVTRITGSGGIGGTEVASSWALAHGDSETAVANASDTIASELEQLGFNMNFAPVADINSNPANPIIGKRAFSDVAEETGLYVLEALEAYEAYSVVPVVKHFPGHGNTQGDSHNDLVYVEGDLETLRNNELVPFQYAIDYGVEVVMMGHIVLTDIENLETYPASMNRGVIQGILQEQMGFEGLIISDSLLMGSITNHMTTEEVIDQGLYAGLDMFLMPETPQAAFDYLLEQATMSEEVLSRVEGSLRKILLLKMAELED